MRHVTETYFAHQKCEQAIFIERENELYLSDSPYYLRTCEHHSIYLQHSKIEKGKYIVTFPTRVKTCQLIKIMISEQHSFPTGYAKFNPSTTSGPLMRVLSS